MNVATIYTHQVLIRPGSAASGRVFAGEPGESWAPVHHGYADADGWLHYWIGREFSGLARPGEWR